MSRNLVSLSLCVLFYASPLFGQKSANGSPPTEQNANGRFADLIKAGLEVEEFQVSVGDRRVSAVFASPPAERLAENPVLLLTIGSPTSHLLPPNDLPAKYFWERGHRVVSLSAPSVASSLGNYRDMVMVGPDPTLAFIESARAVLKHCVERKWAKQDRIVVTGISRYAYLAFRLMAADEQLNIGGGFAPVTDWKDLREFKSVRERKEIANLSLSRFADKLAGKKIILCIGNHDERVGTLSCCKFFLKLNQANHEQGFDKKRVDFFVTPDRGHTCGDQWYARGMESLLNAALEKEK